MVTLPYYLRLSYKRVLRTVEHVRIDGLWLIRPAPCVNHVSQVGRYASVRSIVNGTAHVNKPCHL